MTDANRPMKEAVAPSTLAGVIGQYVTDMDEARSVDAALKAALSEGPHSYAALEAHIKNGGNAHHFLYSAAGAGPGVNPLFDGLAPKLGDYITLSEKTGLDLYTSQNLEDTGVTYEDLLQSLPAMDRLATPDGSPLIAELQAREEEKIASTVKEAYGNDILEVPIFDFKALAQVYNVEQSVLALNPQRRSKLRTAMLSIAAGMLLVGGCQTGIEYQKWRQPKSFLSADDAVTKQVYERDVQALRDQLAQAREQAIPSPSQAQLVTNLATARRDLETRTRERDAARASAQDLQSRLAGIKPADCSVVERSYGNLEVRFNSLSEQHARLKEEKRALERRLRKPVKPKATYRPKPRQLPRAVPLPPPKQKKRRRNLLGNLSTNPVR